MKNTFTQMTDPMKTLAIADPETAGEVHARLVQLKVDPDSPTVGILVNDVIAGLSIDKSLGRAIADGYIRMISADVGSKRIALYSRVIRREADENTTCAVILAGSMVSVLIWGDDSLIDDFFRATALLKKKWLYALSGEPLDVVSELIGPEGTDAGKAWLGFLCDVFTHDLTYNQFRRFSSIFPKAVSAWPASKRPWRISQMRRIVRRDFNLACVFADALNRELSLLSEAGLEAFVTEGLTRYKKDEIRGTKFLELATRSAVDACLLLRVSGVLSLCRQQLSSYLQARCGRAVPIQPMSAIAGILTEKEDNEVLACFDGRTLFLADEINRHASHHLNDSLYKALAWFEAGLFEFGTFDFDLEKIAAICPQAAFSSTDNESATDMERFFEAFPDPRIARDLFTVFEYGRVRTLLEKTYPGGARRYFSMLREEAEAVLRKTSETSFVSVLFAGIVLGVDMDQWISRHDQKLAARTIIEIFNRGTAGAIDSEASARGVFKALKGIGNDVFSVGRRYLPLKTPFGLRVRPELFYAAFASYEKQAVILKEKIARWSGESVPKSVIRRRLINQGGVLSVDDIRDMINDARRRSGRPEESGKTASMAADVEIDALYGDSGVKSSLIDDFTGSTFRYREWDHYIGDYLADHVMVRQRELASGDTDFYRTALTRNSGLIKKIRYAFEMLKPEGISILRKWREGDDFDYRQLLEYAIDKKSGRTPSERIYIKRLKRQRDVAVLLLIDFSRSTSNKVAGSETTMVLDVEKEALVLFCEALNVTGDPFAIAGFSGTGRLGVDYFVVKSFEEPVTGDVERRIGAVIPQRNTRMGAAVRHATAVFSGINAKSKLMIIISDGFPNDIDYKREYALADTRRSLLEARARGIIVHSITINIAGDARLDDLYGRVRHSVISDVRELPDRLIRIYGRLTA